MLSLIEADEKAEKAEAGSDSYEIRRLREKTRAKILAFLERRGRCALSKHQRTPFQGTT